MRDVISIQDIRTNYALGNMAEAIKHFLVDDVSIKS